MKKYLAILLILTFNLHIYSQELNCQVNVNSRQIQGTNKEVYQTLRTSIFEFMNNKKWTDHTYSNEERIECTILINISERISTDEFKGTIHVQAKRPVFGASYETDLLNHIDKDFHFRYVEFETLEFNETTHMSNLTSVLAFYAYVILGLDYDTFSIEGGTQYFQKAESIVTNAQNAAESGWKAFESLNNRFHIVENYLNPAFSPLRECNYNYHRLGLDRLSDKEAEARGIIAEGLLLLRQVHQKKPLAFAMKLFFNAKADEIVKIFGKSFPDEKARVTNLLKEIDPANIAKYESIMK